MARDTGVWMYAVTQGLEQGQLAGLRGVAGAPVCVVDEAGLCGVIASVDLAEFGEESLRQHFEDQGWLETTARAHDGVINAVSRLGPTLPVRLATVYRSDDRVRELLAGHGDDFVQGIRRVTGRTEWGVKAYVDPSAESEPDPQVEAVAGVGPGAAYLRRRRAELSAQESVEVRLTEHVQDIHAGLRQHAVDGRRYPPQQSSLARGPGRMVLNGAYLVDDDRAGEFAGVVDAYTTQYRGIRFEKTGPWPPYSFAGVEAAEPG
jgi:Gas vesicle synthesis protein GvpL/GvpF